MPYLETPQKPTTPLEVYSGSDGAATKALYARLEECGPAGLVALNLFRAQKCSSRAMVYLGGIEGKGSFAKMVYERKTWSLGQLCHVLINHWRDLRISWGWKRDPLEKYFPWVLYVDLPVGQVSFHSNQRLTGPDYLADWDGMHKSEERIITYVSDVLSQRKGNLSLF